MVFDHVDSQTTGRSNVSCIDSERGALLKFKSSLVFDAKRLSDWSNENKDCCRWEGIRCSKAGRVVTIDLHRAWNYTCKETLTWTECDDLGRIRGEINPSLLHLSHLNYLDLSNNYFTRVPEFIGSLKRLRHLNLSHNPLTGKVPHQLGNLSVLESLDLNLYNSPSSEIYIQVDSLAWVARLTSLKHLDLTFVSLQSAPDWLQSISKIPSLRRLYLGFCDLPFPAAIEINASTSLEVVDLSAIFTPNLNLVALSPWLSANTKLVDLTMSTFYEPPSPIPFPNYLTKLVSIKYPDLSDNYLEGALPETFSNLRNLIKLDLSFNDLQALLPETFSNLSHLIKLDLSFNGLQAVLPETFSNLINLENLDLSGNNITGVLPGVFRNLSNLVTLDMSFNDLEGALPETFSNLINLRTLVLSFSGLKGDFPETFSNLTNLITLDLSDNEIEGVLPETLSNLSHLITLDVSKNRLEKSHGFLQSGSSSLQKLLLNNNKLQGSLPNLQKFPFLQVLNLAKNNFEFEGRLAQLLQQSTNLIKLDVSSNHFYGTLTEAPFQKLTNLQVLSLSLNSLTLNFSPTFTPQFQLQTLKLSGCKFGNIFPQWLRTQKNLTKLDISSSGFSGTIPGWFWNMSSRLEYLNVSHNSISGSLPPNSLSSCDYVDLNSNRFYGILPSFSETLTFLDVSSNAFSGGITFLCGNGGWLLSYLDLSNNFLSGVLPNCWDTVGESLGYINLENNNFTGSLPSSMGSLSTLWSLRLRNNSFSGNLSQSLENCPRLVLLDLGHNQFSGHLPDWLGTIREFTSGLLILRLNSNKFEGDIPPTLCGLNNLQILDLSFNNISGSIPLCINNFTAMAQMYVAFTGHFYPGGYTEDMDESDVIDIISLDDFTAWVFWKGFQVEFKNVKTIELLRYIDLSSNNLSGLIPEELTSLVELVVVNLSRNVLIGPIPNKIGEIRKLESLDLSHNLLSGEIPLSMADLSGLSYLDLSYNNLTGRIPVSTQLSTFDATKFQGNPDLCGAPLSVSCDPIKNVENNLTNDEGGDDNEKLYMFISILLGFIVGFWGVCGPLLIKASWRRRYFQTLTHIKERLHVAILLGVANLRRRFTS